MTPLLRYNISYDSNKYLRTIFVGSRVLPMTKLSEDNDNGEEY